MKEKIYMHMFNKGKPYWIEGPTRYYLIFEFREYDSIEEDNLFSSFGTCLKGFENLKSFLGDFVSNEKHVHKVNIEGYLPGEFKTNLEDVLKEKGFECQRSN